MSVCVCVLAKVCAFFVYSVYCHSSVWVCVCVGVRECMRACMNYMT